ncbi:conserved exported hypothetical protein [Paraburkholderia tropica]|uniref:DUF2145 domain-containing protein n=1 Tax=Paraburkholderia tropica TaxID=92647 RepID=UPI001CB5EDAD|nr:DUF2145 domain-containing protein [Paraburkholderia tropica]CAG9227172.1 conserved exported hypothetical protein [Paraburkholderia tropica]
MKTRLKRRLMRSLRPGLLSFAAALLLANSAWAGQGCSDKPIEPGTVRTALQTAAQLQQQLDQLSPKVALVARVGQDLSAYGLRYSHLAFVSRTAPDQPWRVSHLLNDCGAATSALWREGLGNFFMDDMFSFDSLLIVPDAPTQDRLARLLRSPAALEQMHSSSYSMVAYPFSVLHQNSNQWALEILAEGLSGQQFVKRADAQAWLKTADYQPDTLKIGTLKRLGGRVFKANVAFDDHPTDQRVAGNIQTITVDSMVRFLTKASPATQVIPVSAPRMSDLLAKQ